MCSNQLSKKLILHIWKIIEDGFAGYRERDVCHFLFSPLFFSEIERSPVKKFSSTLSINIFFVELTEHGYGDDTVSYG